MSDHLTDSEIEAFKSIKDLKVVFDIGVRECLDYLLLMPDVEYHLFEPHPKFFGSLVDKVLKLSPFTGAVHLNNYGLGETEKSSSYNPYLQAFMDGVARPGWGGDLDLPIKTLDSYIQVNNIKRIDFI